MYLGVLVGGTARACYWEFSHLRGIQLRTKALISVLPNQGQEVTGTEEVAHLSHLKLHHQQLDQQRFEIPSFDLFHVCPKENSRKTPRIQ